MSIPFHPFDYPVNCAPINAFLKMLSADLGQPAADAPAQQSWYVDTEGRPCETPDDCDQCLPYMCVVIYTRPSDRIVLKDWPVLPWWQVHGDSFLIDSFTHAEGHDVVYLTEDLHDDLVNYWQSLNMARADQPL